MSTVTTRGWNEQVLEMKMEGVSRKKGDYTFKTKSTRIHFMSKEEAGYTSGETEEMNEKKLAS